MANLSEDKVALVIGRLHIRCLYLEDRLTELEGQYERQANTLDMLQHQVVTYEKEAEANAVPSEGSRNQGT